MRTVFLALWLLTATPALAANPTVLGCSNHADFACAGSSTSTGLTLGTGLTALYFPIAGIGTAAVALVGVQMMAPGDLSVYAMTCAIGAAPGGANTRIFDLVTGATPTVTSVTCTIGSAATDCTFNDTAVTVTKGTLMNLRSTATGVLPAATSVGCVLYFTNGALLR